MSETTSKVLSTNQDSIRSPEGKLNKGVKLNPDGKGGFGDNPQHRNNGRWSKEGSISYNYNKIIRMTPEELAEFKPTTMAEKIALARVRQASDEKFGLADAKELADRTEGKAPQFFGVGDKNDYEDIFEEFSVEELRRLAAIDAQEDSQDS